jgi:5-methyltetrahydrofolate--homocysteine methyltransferase
MVDYERMKEVILTGRVGEISGLVKRALHLGTTPEDLIDQGLIAGMNEVGTRFKHGDMFIPEVLVSARTMHRAMEILRPLLTKEGAKY